MLEIEASGIVRHICHLAPICKSKIYVETQSVQPFVFFFQRLDLLALGWDLPHRRQIRLPNSITKLKIWLDQESFFVNLFKSEQVA